MRRHFCVWSDSCPLRLGSELEGGNHNLRTAKLIGLDVEDTTLRQANSIVR